MRDQAATAERRRQRANATLIVAGFCAARGLMEAAYVYATRGVPWRTAFALTLPSWLWLAPLGAGAVMLAIRFPIGWRNGVRHAVVHGVASGVFGLVHVIGITPFRMLLSGQAPTWAGFVPAFALAFRLLFYLDVLTYWAVVGMSLALHYSNLRTSLAEARLAALRAQLNPHFLFNTLNAISTLALKGDEPAVTETIGRLSGLLRAALDEHIEEIPLARELEFLDDYVAIQRVRFADRLCVEKCIEPQTLRGLVPTMILQPIVENAIEHGVNVQRAVGRVNVSAVRDHGALLIEVRDSGPGFPQDAASNGIGLANTRARLEQLYGAYSSFEYGTAAEGGACVRITLPFHETAL